MYQATRNSSKRAVTSRHGLVRQPILVRRILEHRISPLHGGAGHPVLGVLEGEKMTVSEKAMQLADRTSVTRE